MRPRVWLAAILVALMQTGVIAYIIVNRAIHLAHGREIVLDVIPVDPRDLLRGDYVRLSYPVSRINGSIVHLPEYPEDGMPIFVTLERQGQAPANKWVAVAASTERPASPDTEGKVVLRGRLASWYAHDTDGRANKLTAKDHISVNYGIETYFIPEGTGAALERMTREGVIKTIVNVGRDGRAAIKGIIIDGERHDETLY
jgi:uncharacterized membrane-anchored protein